jgi:hypothetical protein
MMDTCEEPRARKEGCERGERPPPAPAPRTRESSTLRPAGRPFRPASGSCSTDVARPHEH